MAWPLCVVVSGSVVPMSNSSSCDKGYNSNCRWNYFIISAEKEIAFWIRDFFV